MAYPVELLDEVKRDDVPRLREIDPALPRRVAEIALQLRTDPWIGAEMRARRNLRVLANCRKIPFDVHGWKGKPRFRLVYRNDPSDGAIAVVLVLSAGPRSDLEAYRQAQGRIAPGG